MVQLSPDDAEPMATSGWRANLIGSGMNGKFNQTTIPSTNTPTTAIRMLRRDMNRRRRGDLMGPIGQQDVGFRLVLWEFRRRLGGR